MLSARLFLDQISILNIHKNNLSNIIKCINLCETSVIDRKIFFEYFGKRTFFLDL